MNSIDIHSLGLARIVSMFSCVNIHTSTVVINITYIKQIKVCSNGNIYIISHLLHITETRGSKTIIMTPCLLLFYYTKTSYFITGSARFSALFTPVRRNHPSSASVISRPLESKSLWKYERPFTPSPSSVVRHPSSVKIGPGAILTDDGCGP